MSKGNLPADAINATAPIQGTTSVDKLYADGYFGNDITAAIIDAGIDYTHPATVASLILVARLLAARSLPPTPILAVSALHRALDDNPLDQYNGPGTYSCVAGIIDADPYNTSDVTYESSIDIYHFGT